MNFSLFGLPPPWDGKFLENFQHFLVFRQRSIDGCHFCANIYFILQTFLL
jgi:hypothetical protein